MWCLGTWAEMFHSKVSVPQERWWWWSLTGLSSRSNISVLEADCRPWTWTQPRGRVWCLCQTPAQRGELSLVSICVSLCLSTNQSRVSGELPTNESVGLPSCLKSSQSFNTAGQSSLGRQLWLELHSVASRDVYPAFSLVELLHCCALIGREIQSGEIFSCTERSYYRRPSWCYASSLMP